MGMAMIMVPLLSLIGLVGFVWLCVVAFRRHPGWGLLVLFLSPITAIVFAIKYWQESKKPFLVYMASFTACMAVVAYIVSTVSLSMMALARSVPGLGGRLPRAGICRAGRAALGSICARDDP